MLERHWIKDDLQAPLTLGVVLVAFWGANHLQHEAGLVAVTLAGFLMANQNRVIVRHIVIFKEHVSILLISNLFVILAAGIPARALLDHLWPRGLVFLIVLIVVIRPLAVYISTIGSPLDGAQKAFLSLMFPRGIVAAAVAPLFALELSANNIKDAETLVPYTYLVVVGTVMFYALATPQIASRLGLTSKNPQGVLFVGANRVARAIGEALVQAGFQIALIDTNRQNVAKARLEGLPAHYANVLAEGALDDLDLGTIGRILATTPNDEVNSLAAVAGSELFGRAGAYQVAVEEKAGPRGERAAHLRGRTAFGDAATYSSLALALAQGAVVKSTTISDDFPFSAFREHYGDSAVLLFTIDPSGTLRIVENQHAPVTSGWKVVALVDDVQTGDADA